MYPKLFATQNENKFREARDILGCDLKQVTIELFEPQGLKVEDVVCEKAKNAFQKTGEAVLVEDTSLEFEAWNGLPGALVKWFLDAVDCAGILKMLREETNRKAVAKTAVGFFDGVDFQVFVGEISGIIPDEVRGSHGFGFDSIFIPDGFEKSFAEMTALEKNTISMRKIAFTRMKKALSQK